MKRWYFREVNNRTLWDSSLTKQKTACIEAVFKNGAAGIAFGERRA